MDYAFSFLNKPCRAMKPRSTGITMVLDKNMTTSELESWLPANASFVDLVKFGWGTSMVLDRASLARKCKLLHQYDIDTCPGGTLFELAFLQGRIPQFLDEARLLGFTCIEVSNGTVPICEEKKLESIQRSLEAGFRVVSEVGSKNTEEDRRIGINERIENTLREIERGVWKVIIEGRESGTHGIFDLSGKTQIDLLGGLLDAIPLNSLIFEAPLKSQQADLILRLGSDVNLGNIAPQEVIPLETLRLGLRGDTLRKFHMSLPTVHMELGASAAWAASQRGDVIVVVDALRASTTIVTALAHGAHSVKPVSNAEECVGEVTAGERGGKKIAQLDYDNSPLSFANDMIKGKQLVLTTTNGTECILAAAAHPEATVIIGALINAAAVARFVLELARTSRREITIIIAGRNNQPAIEDIISASEIVFQMQGAPVDGSIKPTASHDYVFDFFSGESGKNLAALGKSEDIFFSAKKDRYNVVPLYSSGLITLTSK